MNLNWENRVLIIKCFFCLIEVLFFYYFGGIAQLVRSNRALLPVAEERR